MPRIALSEQMPLFVSGQSGYHTCRIPALAVAGDGTLLAFCEGRRDDHRDSGTIHLLLRRSADCGRTWGPVQAIMAEEGVTCGNPCPVPTPTTGRIWLPFCKNRAEGPERMICEGKAPRTAWITHSDDAGATWTRPIEITADVKRPNWTWYATGPGHGIALATGRLVVPCDHVVGVHYRHGEDPHHSHVILSDDGGETWRVGAVLPEGTNECAVAESAPGALYINCRNHGEARHRAVAWSHDGGESFADFHRDGQLIEPVCQASLASLPPGARGGSGCVLFANPASLERRRMTVRLTEDGCRTWSAGRVLHEGPSAYSDLAVAPDGSVFCLYERGREHPYETLTLARFDVDGPGDDPGGAGRSP